MRAALSLPSHVKRCHCILKDVLQAGFQRLGVPLRVQPHILSAVYQSIFSPFAMLTIPAISGIMHYTIYLIYQ